MTILDQRQEALSEANARRVALREARAALRTGRWTIPDVMADPPEVLADFTLIEIVSWVHADPGRWMRGRSAMAFGEAAVAHNVNLLSTLRLASVGARKWVAGQFRPKPRKRKRRREKLERVANHVPNEVFRERFLELGEREGLTAAQLGARLGWFNNRRADQGEYGDTTRVLRALGLRPEAGGEARRFVQYETAVVLARALDLDPVDVGI